MKADRLGTLLLVACALVLILAVGGAAVVDSWQRRADEKLQHDSPDAGHLAVLLDLSDPTTVDQAAQLEDRLRDIAETDLKPGDVVSVWKLGPSLEGPLHRVLRLHCPRRRVNPVYQNPRHAQERYDSLFVFPLGRICAGLPVDTAGRWSPIMEAICAMTELPELHGGSRRRLVVMSDLQQNTPTLSFCARQPAFDTFRKTPLFPGLQPDLRGVAVDILFIPRARQDLSIELSRRRFWRSYFLFAGAQSVGFERL